MEILAQFIVNGETFSTIEEAQNYVDTNADAIRISAFVAHLKANGSKRISALVSETLKGFIEFEKGLAVKKSAVPPAATETLEDSSTTPVVLAASSDGTDDDGDNPPWSGDDVEDDGDDTIQTGEDQEQKVEETTVTENVSGNVAAGKTSSLAALSNTEKSANLFAKKA